LATARGFQEEANQMQAAIETYAQLTSARQQSYLKAVAPLICEFESNYLRVRELFRRYSKYWDKPKEFTEERSALSDEERDISARMRKIFDEYYAA
jgi:hypothetical protein